MPLFVIALSAITATTGMAQAGGASGGEQSAPPATAATPVPAPTVDAEGKAIFEANCSSCHEITDATSQAKDLAGWTETIAKMVSYGAPVATEDQQRIAEYLAATYPAPRL
ncbi:MAG: cytochrome c [Methylococcaceae bacterium]|nr:cytochrome c [Methylococcaceae bacterium]